MQSGDGSWNLIRLVPPILAKRRVLVVRLDIGGMAEVDVAQQVADRLIGVEFAVVARPAERCASPACSASPRPACRAGHWHRRARLVGREIGRRSLPRRRLVAAKLSCAIAVGLVMSPLYVLISSGMTLRLAAAGNSSPVPTIAPPSATMAWPLT